MSLDVVEIALDRWTDWPRFEGLACEIMRQEGYADIKPLGGGNDQGADAELVKYFASDGMRVRTIFQFSMQKSVEAKVERTIQRLDEAGQKYQRLVIVTSRAVSAESQRTQRDDAKRAHDVELEFFERKTLVSRLADSRNGIFRRYFPDIRAQVDTLLVPPLPSSVKMEEELLKVSYAISFSEHGSHTRKALVDHTVLAMLAATKQPMTVAEIAAFGKTHLGSAAPAKAGQLTAALQRLTTRDKFALKSGDKYRISPDGVARIEATRASVDAATSSVVADLVAEVVAGTGAAVDEMTEGKLVTNARDVLLALFRLYGIEITNSLVSKQAPALLLPDSPVEVREVARRGVPPVLGDMLLLAIGKAVAAPTPEQTRYFASVARAYIGAQVLNADPVLREFQRSRFSRKLFVLDTDVVLATIVDGHPLQAACRAIVAGLKALGATVAVPIEVVEEVVEHLDISVATFDYFGAALAQLTPELAQSRIRNALVFGYWGITRGKSASRDGFLRYRANYYDQQERVAFTLDVIREALPAAVIKPIADLTGEELDPDLYAKARQAYFEVTAATVKGRDRTEEQNRAIADRDARLMLLLYRSNQRDAPSDFVLGRRAYLVTASSRYIQVDRRLGLGAKLAARPQVLMGLIDLVSNAPLDDAAFVALFENSILQQAVEACWSDIKALLDAGVALRYASVVRLRFDLERRLSDRISKFENANTEEDEDREFLLLISDADSLGYAPVAAVERLKSRGELVEAKLDEVMRENEELREAVRVFGRKKQRWAERLAQQKKP